MSKDIRGHAADLAVSGLDFNLEGQPVSVMIEVLSAVAVEVEDAHCVPEVGIPRRWEVHGQGQTLLGFTRQLALQSADGAIHESSHSCPCRTCPPPQEPR